MTEQNKSDENQVEALKKKLQVSFTNAWDRITDTELNVANELVEDYKIFLDKAKTEREFVEEAVHELEAAGYVHVRSKDKLVAGDKVYTTVHKKGLVAAVVGTDAVENGFNIVGAHVDSPRLDLKQRARLTEDALLWWRQEVSVGCDPAGSARYGCEAGRRSGQDLDR